VFVLCAPPLTSVPVMQRLIHVLISGHLLFPGTSLTFYSGTNGNTPSPNDDVVIIGMDANFKPYNNIDSTTQYKLVGFDVELTQMICADQNMNCAIVTAPWQSAIPATWADLGWTTNSKTYPGIGIQNQWYHCISGARNTIPRQMGMVFSNPYTDPNNDKAAFYISSTGSNISSISGISKVGLQSSYAVSAYFLQKLPSTYSGMTALMFSSLTALKAALDSGNIDAIFYGKSDMTLTGVAQLGSDVSGWANGVSYMCNPSRLDVVSKLNQGLTNVINSGSYTTLCNKMDYKNAIPCLSTPLSFSNSQPNNQNRKADIIIAMEADFPPYASVSASSQLVGFDVEFTKKVCTAAALKCAIITAPWQSAIAKSYADLGWSSNSKTYPGLGLQNMWYHCISGSRNTIARQQSLAFTNPYTDPANDKAIYIALKSFAGSVDATASSVKVGLQSSYAVSSYFENRIRSRQSSITTSSNAITYYDSAADLFKALADGVIHVVFYGKPEYQTQTNYNSNTMMEVSGTEISAWSQGISYMCNPSRPDLVSKLNQGIKSVIGANAQGSDYRSICTTFSGVPCFTSAPTEYTGSQAPRLVGTTSADIIIAMTVDFGEHQRIDSNSKLTGFDVELTQRVCSVANLRCAIMMVPWQSVVAGKYSNLGWSNNPKTYPGVGVQNKWFHCAAGARNTVDRRVSFAFTRAYTDPSQDKGVFIKRKGYSAVTTSTTIDQLKAMSTLKVGLQTGYAASTFFRANYPNVQVVEYATASALFTALTTSPYAIQLVFYGKGDYTTVLNTATMEVTGPEVSGLSAGIGFACRPDRMDLVKRLDDALQTVMASTSYRTFCTTYSSILCYADGSQSTPAPNLPAYQNSGVARSDLVIAVEADYGQFNNINSSSELVGLDIDLIKDICSRQSLKCAVMTVPWQSAIAKSYNDLGWSDNPKTYPGVGFQNMWYDCISGARNTIQRQQSLLFTPPYTDPSNDKAAFIGLTTNAVATGLSRSSNDLSTVKVGVQGGYAVTSYLDAHATTYNARSVHRYNTAAQLFSALVAGTVDVVFYGKADLSGASGYNSATMTEVGPEVAAWANGNSFMCHPAKMWARNQLTTGWVAIPKAERLTYNAAYNTIPVMVDASSYDGLGTYTPPTTTTTTTKAAASTAQAMCTHFAMLAASLIPAMHMVG